MADTLPVNGGSRPVPDPTELTDRAIAKEAQARVDAHESLQQVIESQFAIRDERLRAIDIATTIHRNSASHEGVVGLIREHVTSLELLVNSKLDVMDQALRDRDVLAQRESALNALALAAAFNASKEAVAAALTAQKEAAQRQDEANQKAIDKSEAATAERILKLEQLFAAGIATVGGKVEDVKDRVGRIESVAVGGIAQRTEGRASNTATYALIGVIATVLGIVVTISTIVAALKP